MRTAMLATAWVAGVEIAMVVPEIAMILAMRSATIVAIGIAAPVAGRRAGLDRLLLPRRFAEPAKDAALLIDLNLLGRRLLHLLDPLDRLDLLNLFDPPFAPFESRLAGDVLDSLRLRLLRTLDAHRALLTLRPVVRRALGTLCPMFRPLGAMCSPVVAFRVAILRHGRRRDHRPGQQHWYQKSTHHILHQLNPTW